MNIYVAQHNYVIGDIRGNTERIIEEIRRAEEAGADLAVFSEMCICGYPSEDLLLSEEYINQTALAVQRIRQHTDGIAVIIGAPEKDPENQLFNAAWFLHGEEVRHIVRKRILHNGDLNDESRYFQPGTSSDHILFKDRMLAITIGDELMEQEASWQRHLETADLIINIAATCFDYISHAGLSSRLSAAARRFQKPLIYCNAAGAQTNLIFSGSSAIYDQSGQSILSLKSFEPDAAMANMSAVKPAKNPATHTESSLPVQPGHHRYDPEFEIQAIRQALVTGLREYFSKTGLKKAILGNSGGIDSAVTLALACEALGSQNVFSLLMPSQYSSGHSVTDAEQLSKNLNSAYEIIPIEDVFASFSKSLSPLFKDLPQDVTEENIQARVRGTLLMGVANKFQYVLLNTSNKSELAVGYGTLYGDLAGGLSVLGDCYKNQVYALARNINASQEIIPENIINKIPSAELRPNQFDAQSLPPYDLLDPVLFQYIEHGKQAQEIIDMGYPNDIVDFVIGLVNKNEFKRKQFCPILRVSPKAFGSGRRIPVVARYRFW